MPWQQAAFASHALLIGTWTDCGKNGHQCYYFQHRGGRGHTSDDWDVEGRTLDIQIAAPKHGAEETSVGRVALLGNFVAAVELGVAAGHGGLLDGVVAVDGSGIGGAVAGVLAAVADVLVAFSVVAGGLDLAGDKRGCGDGQSQGEDGEDVLGEHVEGCEG